jgi:hypothetical protein
MYFTNTIERKRCRPSQEDTPQKVMSKNSIFVEMSGNRSRLQAPTYASFPSLAFEVLTVEV